MSKFYFSFPSTETAFRVSDDIFGILIGNLNVDGFEKHRLKVVVSELFVNAYLHGNNGDPSKYIDVIMEFSDEEFAVTVKDQGNGIGREKFKALAETLSASMDDHGRGVKIMRRLSDRVDFFKDSDGRFCMRAIKKFDKGAKHSDLAENAG
jgi:serine/threonine-protein kinase RsbW